ncbi:MAG TPA: 4Fe-4S ferredoxin [Bacillota bacterium]|nr:4Fe-4S ferredoxin [Bacillota bacterium]
MSEFSGCPGSRMMQIKRDNLPRNEEGAGSSAPRQSELSQWPVQLHLVSPAAPYFQHADVILAADCVAYALGDFHRDYLKGKALAIACPKLDDGQDTYQEKITAFIDEAEINSLTVMIMEVPCCRGLLALAQQAAGQAKREIPMKLIIVGIQGEILSDEWI